MAVETAVAIDRPPQRFFFVAALALLAIVAGGFWPTLFARPLTGAVDYATGAKSLPPHLLLHGAALTAWFVLFAVQAGLAATGRIAWHRRLGVAAVAGAAAVVVTSVPALAGFLPRTTGALTSAGANGERLAAALRDISWTVVPASIGLVVFVAFVAAGVHFRRSPATHKRLMLFATHSCVFPALSPGRFWGQLLAPFPTPFLGLAMLGAIIWYDLKTGRKVHAATWWGLAANAALLALAPILATSDVGLAYVRWLSAMFPAP